MEGWGRAGDVKLAQVVGLGTMALTGLGRVGLAMLGKCELVKNEQVEFGYSG